MAARTHLCLVYSLHQNYSHSPRENVSCVTVRCVLRNPGSPEARQSGDVVRRGAGRREPLLSPAWRGIEPAEQDKGESNYEPPFPGVEAEATAARNCWLVQSLR
jgi:hypothetical protein